MLDRLKISASDRRWINALRGKDLHNASLVTIDYKTGDVLAYAGSAGYYRESLASPQVRPEVRRRRGRRTAARLGLEADRLRHAPSTTAPLTPGSLLLDITTEFDRGENWAPRDADQLDRGPVLVRKALQYSLNVPAIRALQRVGNEAVADRAEAIGIRFTGGSEAFLQSGPGRRDRDRRSAAARPDLGLRRLANWGYRDPAADDPRGPRRRAATSSTRRRTRSRAADRQRAGGLPRDDILAGNTEPKPEPDLVGGHSRSATARTASIGPSRSRPARPMMPATSRPTATSRRRPTRTRRPSPSGSGWATATTRYPTSTKPATSLTAAAPLWRAFVRDVTDGTPIAHFPARRGRHRDDRRLVGRPARAAGPGSAIKEVFIDGTQPGASNAIDPDGLLYTPGVRRLAGRPAEGRARAVGVGRRRGRLAPPRPARPRRRGPARLAGRRTSGASRRGAAR